MYHTGSVTSRALHLKWTSGVARRRHILGRRDVGHPRAVLNTLLTAAVDSVETERRGEDGPPALSRLHGSSRKALAGAHSLDMIGNRQLRVAGKHKITVHAVDKELVGDGALSRAEALRDHRASVDAPRARRMPQRTSVGENILFAPSEFSLQSNYR